MARTFLTLATLTALGFVPNATVLAADIARTAYKAPAPVVHNWTGCYVGANAGWIGSANNITNHPGAFFGPIETATNTRNLSLDGSGFTGGAQLGCNWQRVGSPLVLGIEADFNGSSLRESTSRAYPADFFFLARIETNNTDVTWFSTIRGRLGYAADRWFVFATGGLAIAHIKLGFTWVAPQVLPPNLFYAGSDSSTQTGWTVGGGVEYALTNNWSVKAEYLYLDFGEFNLVSPNQFGLPNTWVTEVRARDHVVRVGLNYKFY